MREGDFAPGGSFCPQRVLLPNPTSSFNQPPNHSTLPEQFHPPQTKPPSQSSQNPQTKPSPPNPEGNFAPGGSFCQTPPAVLINPLTIPPSTDSSTLPIRAKPPKSSPPHRTRRVIRLLEGDFTPGGSFCCQRVITSGRKHNQQKHTLTPPSRDKPPSQNSSALQIPNPADKSRQFHPPNPAKTRKIQPFPPNREGDSVPGG